jgi:glyoxylase-like metal-dependent hydrolase (beta-lactamase superfamily II)
MFGVIPRVIWSKAITPDDRNRITVAHNCLLLANDNHRILIETGSGNKLDEKMRAIFGLTDYTIAEALRDAGCACEDVGHVIVSHLHFDHAGGLTRRVGDKVELSFPGARIITQKQEWHDAIENNSVMTRTYYRDHLDPIRDRVALVDSAPPFDSAHHPDKDALPGTTVQQRMTRVLPGIDVFLVPGHTWGQQAIAFRDEQDRTIVFTPDVMPTIHHVGAAYNLAYDVEPYTSTLSRRWLLDEAMKNEWLLFLDHEPGNPLVRVRADGKGWYKLEPDEQTLKERIRPARPD